MGERRFLIAAVAALLIAGCGGGNDNGGGGGGNSGGGGSQTASAGAQVFKDAGCGNCHTLKAAGSSGKVGPNLDQLQPSADLVQHQVTNGGGGMPAFKGRLTAAKIKAVAAYVSSNAGK